jgi:xanthine dehydrogenase accessory factor
MSVFRGILNELNAGKKVVMVTELGTNTGAETSVVKTYYTEDNWTNSERASFLKQEVNACISRAFATGELQIIERAGQKIIIIEPFFPQPRLIIFGGGHIAKPLCEFASRAGFAVTVIDDRLSFANQGRFPDAQKVICESFEKCFDLLQFDSYTYAVVVTRGHRHDLDCLRAVVQKQWAYAGMIGSRRRVKTILDQLQNEGYAQDVLSKINAPRGLEIGAVTPEESAMSLLGQVISFRRLQNPSLGRNSEKINWTEFDREVIEELSHDKQEAKVLVTVISARGSVPRRAGAKMLVWPDGRILGSIGGGCSEGLIIQTALDVIRRGGYQIQKIDMTVSVAEDEGMVCGGTMKAVIESV